MWNSARSLTRKLVLLQWLLPLVSCISTTSKGFQMKTIHFSTQVTRRRAGERIYWGETHENRRDILSPVTSESCWATEPVLTLIMVLKARESTSKGESHGRSFPLESWGVGWQREGKLEECYWGRFVLLVPIFIFKYKMSFPYNAVWRVFSVPKIVCLVLI